MSINTPNDIKKASRKYFYVNTDRKCPQYMNEKFDNLLEFIGIYNRHKKKTAIEDAYKAIIIEANEILGYKKGNLENRKLKLSSREISSIRFSYRRFKLGPRKILKVTFKIHYIFLAIQNILKKIKKDHPEEYKKFFYQLFGQKYLDVFYRKHYDYYYNNLDEIKEDFMSASENANYTCYYNLYDDMTAIDSSLQQEIKN